ncbi:MAG: hypothetical protein HQK83_09410 [Fibrobacteria bacterium]|nr:hypothetical protein [Fibrobacteria bacterium]
MNDIKDPKEYNNSLTNLPQSWHNLLMVIVKELKLNVGSTKSVDDIYAIIGKFLTNDVRIAYFPSKVFRMVFADSQILDKSGKLTQAGAETIQQLANTPESSTTP